MEQLTVKALYNLDETIAKDIFECYNMLVAS